MLDSILFICRNYKYAKQLYISNLIRYKILEFGYVFADGAKVEEIQSNILWHFKLKDSIQLFEITQRDYINELLLLEKIKYVFITEDRKIWGLTDKGKEAFNNGHFRSEYVGAFYSMTHINQSFWSLIISVIAIIIAIIAILIK